ncbi:MULTISPECIES: ABC transporter permease [unclassified Leucobacter]|uniref:ABC transporter permease n=1 Tax=unclassified Leucobacter TaxID=2621730 RepID=UPI000621DC02|nr:ABC transporter permease [Leucobacter sp. Ag1]KKI16355.1 diguanylate cyclase [Leucobacter sp. Ag1]
MGAFILKRIGQSIVVVFLVTVIAFALLHALPGGAARATLGKDATPAQIEQFDHDNGFDLPLPQQYARYVGNLAQGDLGYSYKLNQSVTDAISQRLPKTILLSLISTILAIALAIPLGVWQAVRRNRAPDYAVTVAAMLAYSTPIFFLGLVLIILFSQVWPLFPPEAPQGYTVAEVLSDPVAFVLPVVTLAIVTIASYSRYIRSSMVDNLNEQYVRTARAKGLTGFRIVFVHTLRNALFPVITLLGLYIPALFSGALVVETLFNFNGMGLLFWQAAQSRDYPILLGVTIIIAIATVVGALLADMLYAVADPRVRLAGKK